MGFLELDKLHTLELFLTDKGKELMLRENSKGLFDLVSQFSLDDRDYDYRRTSSVWVDGISPVPSGYPLDPVYGTTQGLINDDGLGPPNNDCRPENGSLSGNCWFDMPDVRGHRGQKLINCILTTATTATILSCTNVYCFYDVSSTGIDNAQAAKDGLTEWFAGVTASTPNYTGKIFHIPVYGEAWLNTSYYPWNGKLDSWDWAANGPNNNHSTRITFCGADQNLVTTYSTGNECTNTTYGYGGTFTPPSINLNGMDEPPTLKYPEPVTGLYLQADGRGVRTGDYTGFPVLPPNAISTATGGRAEFWTTGCTFNTLGVGGGSISYSSGIVEYTGITFTANTLTPGMTFDPNVFSGETYLSGYTAESVAAAWPGTPPLSSGLNLNGGEVFNLCEGNCCPDVGYEGPGLFGCQDCSPFDNTITEGRVEGVRADSFLGPYIELSPGISAGTCTIRVNHINVPCEKYRGMDRNVMIVNIFDESEAQPRFSNGGFCALGNKVWYDLTNPTPLQTQTTTLGLLNFYNGLMQGTNPNDITWRLNQNLGYHGGNRGGPCGNRYTTCGAEATGNQAHYPPYGIADDWNQWACCNNNSMGFDADYFNDTAKNPQPTPSWLYSQDLFHKTYSFYNAFRGFVYPVVGSQNSSVQAFPLHLYGAMYGNTISEATFNAKGDNPTVISQLGTLSAITHSNPYSAITAVNYNPTVLYEPGSATEPFDPSQLGSSLGWNDWYSATYGVNSQIDVGAAQTGLNTVRGLRNWGWDFNPTVGCTLPTPPLAGALDRCTNIGDIFSGGTFAADLDEFLSGSTSLSMVLTTGCTECQCLPSVFLDIKGPVLITPDPNAGCLCPDGTYSPECCTSTTPTGEALCGPAPLSTSILISGDPPIGEDGTSSQRLSRHQTYEVPDETSPLMSGLNSPNANLMSLEPARDTNSFSSRYTNKYSIGYDVIFHNYLNKNGDTEFDLELYSVGQYGHNRITEANGGSFYWVIESGYKTSGSIKVTQPCVPLTKIKVNSNKPKYIGGSTSYARAHSNLGDEFKITDNGMDTYILCIGLAMSVHNLMFFETHRYKITGTPKYGYQYTRLA